MPSIISATTTTGLVTSADNSGSLQLATNNGTTAVTIDTSQNVGIGTSSPSARLDIAGNTRIDATGNIYGKSDNTGGLSIYGSGAFNTGAGISLTGNSAGANPNTIVFVRNGYTESMRIDSSGRILAGTTTGGANALLACNSGSNYWQYGASTTGSSIFWVITSGGTGVSLTAGNTSWAAQSDERTKDIIEPIGDALNKVDSLRAVIGKYKTDEEGTRRSFLIAQDVKKVLPEVIDTDTDEQGTLSIRYTEIIPLLVASIKELNAKVEAQAARIAELEGAK